MAKSLRAKNVQKNKTIKRATMFGETHAARTERLAAKLKENAAKQQARMEEDEPASDAMNVEPKKKSTSGWNKKKKHGNKRPKSKKGRK